MRFLKNDDERIVAQPPIQLAVADIDGENLPHAVSQQTIAEAAGGCPDINDDFPADFNVKPLQRCFQFAAAPARLWPRIRFDSNRRMLVNQGARFCRRLLIHEDIAGQDFAAAFLAARNEPALDQQLI